MGHITVKQLELAGAGVIRSELIKSTISGKIYGATIYYNDMVTDVEILYYRNGDTKLLGPTQFTESDIKAFEDLLIKIIPSLPHPDYKTLNIVRAGLTGAIIITAYNVITITPDVYSILAIAIDTAITVFIAALYRAEGKRYVKENK